MVDPELERSSLQFTDAINDKRYPGGWGEWFPRLWNPETVAYKIDGCTETRVLDVESLNTVLHS